MPLPKVFTTVTPLSKTIALILFVTLPIVAFIFGMSYQKMINENGLTITPTPPQGVSCTLEAKICPDGTAVGRIPPDCEFALCPSINSPDSTQEYQCPETEWVDCMPSIDGRESARTECTKEYLDWAKANCPDFQGAAY